MEIYLHCIQSHKIIHKYRNTKIHIHTNTITTIRGVERWQNVLSTAFAAMIWLDQLGNAVNYIDVNNINLTSICFALPMY